jgi:hypothetical protein
VLDAGPVDGAGGPNSIDMVERRKWGGPLPE